MNGYHQESPHFDDTFYNLKVLNQNIALLENIVFTISVFQIIAHRKILNVLVFVACVHLVLEIQRNFSLR